MTSGVSGGVVWGEVEHEASTSRGKPAQAEVSRDGVGGAATA